MKFITTLFLALVIALPVMSQIYTNGVYVENGKTVEVDKTVHQIGSSKTSKTLYFSNELIVKINTNSDFFIDSFFQEVLNTNKLPEKVKFGSQNFAVTLTEGEATMTYMGSDSNSSCVISTQLADIELLKGNFYFKVTENKVIVLVLDGSLNVHSNKKQENVVHAGYAAIVTPNDIGILENKVSVSVEKLNTSVIDKLNIESKGVTSIKGNIIFSLINGKIVGIVIN